MAETAAVEPRTRRQALARKMRDRDVAIPAIASAALFIELYAFAMLRYRAIEGSYDLAYFRQAAWLIARGRPPFITSRGLYILGDHSSPIFYPIAWVTRVVPDIPFLLGIQSLALALGVVPLYLICRRLAGLGVWPSTAVILAYSLYPALHNVNVADYHPETVAVPALFGAVLFGLRDRWWPFAACVAVPLLSREDLTVVIVFLGVFLALQGRRRAGVITAVVGLAVLVFDTRVLQPHFAGGFVQASFLETYGTSLGEIIRTMLLNPGRVLKDLMTEQNLAQVIALTAPLAFLPFLAPRFLVPAIPLEVLYLLSTRPAAHDIKDQYTVAFIPFIFIAAAMALGGSARPRVPTQLIGAVIVASVLTHASLANTGLAANPWRWRVRDDVDYARQAAAELVAPGAAVVASDRVRPLVARRRDVYTFPGPFEGYEPRRDPIPLRVRQREVAYLFVDTVDEVQWYAASFGVMDEIVAREGFEKIFDRHGILVFRRQAQARAPT